MACCVCHTHPNEDGECCPLCNCAALKKNTEKLLQVENSKNEKPKDVGKLSGLIGLIRLCVAMLIIAGMVVSAGWQTVPGFLKPDKEVPFVSAGDSSLWVIGNYSLDFIWGDHRVRNYISPYEIDVALRSDGKSCTTLLLEDIKYPGKYDCKRVTILVPNPEGLEKWNEFLNNLRNKYEDAKRAREEEINSLSAPREVLPPNK